MTDTLKKPAPAPTDASENTTQEGPAFGEGPFLSRGISAQPPEVQQAWREKAWAVWERRLENAPTDIDEEEVAQDVEEALQEVRAEMRRERSRESGEPCAER